MIDPAFITSNYVEAGLWIVIGAGFVIASIAKPNVPRADCLVAAMTFIAFGCSDLVETRTGAWWRPWWLFVWKGVCVLMFVLLLARYRKRKVTAKP